MQVFGTLVMSPLWGSLSVLFFLQIWLGLANFVIHLIGFSMARVSRGVTGSGMAMALICAVASSLLLQGGFWLTSEFLPFGHTTSETVAYWIFAVLSAIGTLAQAPAKLRKTWRNATIVGSFERDIALRKLGLNPGG